MAKAYDEELIALRSLVKQAYDILSTTRLPDGRAERACELLRGASALTDDLLNVTPAAALLGSKGGAKTAERGPEYYAKIAAMRKTKADGRPRKQPEP